MRADVKELLWLGMEPVGDSLRAAAHVQRTSDARRTTLAQLSAPAQRAIQRINKECAVPRTAPGAP
jgi:hypothetical protein